VNHAGGRSLRMTVSVQPKDTTQMRVRANAQLVWSLLRIRCRIRLFRALSKGMFLTAHRDDEENVRTMK